MTLDEIRLQQLLGPFNRPQGIASLSQAASPLSFQYTDEIYPEYGSPDYGYVIGPYATPDSFQGTGFSLTPDSFQGTGFNLTPDMGYPFAPANRLGGLDLPRFEGVSELGRQDEDVEQVEYLPGQEPSGIEKLINKVSSIPGAVRSGITGVLSRFNPISMLGSFIGGGLGSLRNLNQRIQGSTFGQSQNLAEYFSKRREAKAQELASRRINDAARIQAARAVRTGSTSGNGEGKSSYTPSISPSQAASNRESRRGGQYK